MLPELIYAAAWKFCLLPSSWVATLLYNKHTNETARLFNRPTLEIALCWRFL